MDGNTLIAGTVFVAPADNHLLLDTTGVLRLSGSAKVHHVRPAADPLFVSVADYYRERTIGVVLTGYGVDGSLGVKAISKMGGYVIAQEPGPQKHRGCRMPPSKPDVSMRSCRSTRLARTLGLDDRIATE